MALPQHVIRGVGGTISLDLLSRPTNAAACSVTVLTDQGATVLSGGAVTLSSISTTLNGAHTAGATSIVLTNASPVAAGDAFWVRTPDEKVRCKTKSSNTITLWRPLLQDHASGVAVQGTRCTATISAAQADATWWDGRVQWTIDGVVAHFSAIECTRYPLQRLATVDDLAAIEPLIAVVLEAEADVERLLDAAHEDVLSDIGARGRARVFPASTEFVRAVAYRFLENHYMGAGSASGERLFERYRARAQHEVTKLLAIVPRDVDQDASANEAEDRASFGSVRLHRG